ncbi:galactitol-1-phosphate 5-dehydrogenase [Vallitalea longa]|uniref:Galactitol-1-phosphate 5-dehydrogenase n=1 Tax=Vallitalea longa TaxID=2936439 RepID=A0A9W5Y7T5_9FIRM|nr:galactitol-1-phosphate 5-dehydrogenase [Vallitalea longa]GKX27899.1 galactitol-1-phosphate 5-dehydrogenase [Vallitalea longa]
MKAAVLYGQKDIRVENIEKPTINDNEVLINVKASGVCGSDIPRVLGTASHYYPNVFGHEFSGEVVEVGKNVTSVKVNDKVSVAPLKPCHECEDCKSGNHALCKNYSFIGSREYGAWAEYVKAPETNIVKLPDEVSYVQGAFLEPITVALHGLLVMDFKPMTSVAITGMGTIGLLTLQCAKIMGAKDITVFDIDDARLNIAKELGADHVINTLNDDINERVKEITNGKGYEMVLETAGVPFTELLCLEIAGNKGSVMYIGTPHTEFTIKPKQFECMNRKELTVKGSWMSYSAPFPGKEWTLGANYLGTGQIQVEKLIDRTIDIEDIGKAFEDIEAKKVSGKVMMTL